jgi:hypothetical protein
MAWIKRNLFFTVGGVIALALLGAAVFYGFKSWGHYQTAFAKLGEAYTDLQNDYNKKPSPSSDNIAAAQTQEQQLKDWITQAQAHFVPVPPIPNPPGGAVTTEEFAGSLRKAIQDMQTDATNANVDLPPDYSFSFAAERNLVTFAPGSLNSLASHLGEVKALCEILFDAKVNALDGIQREIVSDNDTTGPQSDYSGDKTATTDLGAKTPYILTFRCFSSDLANVLSKFASSDHGFVVTGINVMPAAATAAVPGQNPPPTPTTPAGGTAVMQTVLDEQLLRVTLGIEVVKLSKQ